MAAIDQTNDTTKDICWARGDSGARGFQLKDSAGVVIDITGFGFILTVNSEKDPTTNPPEFTITGVITDALNGRVSFSPTTGDTDIVATGYFYDIQQTDGGGAIDTLIKGKCKIIMDITK